MRYTFRSKRLPMNTVRDRVLASRSSAAAVALKAMSAEPRLCTLHLGDDPSAWRLAGFEVHDEPSSRGFVQLGDVRVQLHGVDGPRGLLRWDLSSEDSSPEDSAPGDPPPADTTPQGSLRRPGDSVDLDGLPTSWVSGTREPITAVHPNGVNAIDHLVVASPDVDRTVSALTAHGFRERRRRTTGRYGEPMIQVFFWAGNVIVELVGPPAVAASDTNPGPAAFFGLALTSADLDHTASELGELLGTQREAVQPGRRIATLRFNQVGGSVPTVVMGPHPGGPAPTNSQLRL